MKILLKSNENAVKHTANQTTNYEEYVGREKKWMC